jgi:PHD/YefM family antitoxin component YafN of YafNO toxin-antitoxin module
MGTTTTLAQVRAHLVAAVETLEILSDPTAMAEIREARAAIEAGATMDLPELPRRTSR